MWPEDRAKLVRERPEVKRWMKRFQALAASMPPDVWVFVASGTPTVHALDEDGQRYEATTGGVDRRAEIGAVPCGDGRWDGGDY